MRLGFTTWNFEEEIISGQKDVMALMDDAKAMGFACIEFMGYHLASIDSAYLQTVKARAQGLGLTISAIDVRNMNFGGRWFEFRTDVAMIKFWILAAAMLGCPVIGVFLGRFDAAEARRKQIETDIQGFRECLAFAESYGVKLGIENHRIYIANKDADPDEQELEDLLYIVRTIGSPSLGAIPDSDNFFRRGFADLTSEERERNYSHFAQLMKHAVHAHIKIKGRGADAGALHCDLNRLARILVDSNYDGDVSLEFMKPLKADKREALESNLQVFQAALSAAGARVE
ncbi:MAG: sugar phosphate isomerase/epimerase [Candidatus Sumerlaeota bacterium]|nr:sugar phosphate isomerase/epimerase [Candidatus Sumerlaeota bacterium]